MLCVIVIESSGDVAGFICGEYQGTAVRTVLFWDCAGGLLRPLREQLVHSGVYVA